MFHWFFSGEPSACILHALVQTTDSFSAAFSAKMLELENNPISQAAPVKKT